MCQNIIHNNIVLHTLASWMHLGCILDASFDKINHFKLFRKLLDRKTPFVIVRILLFWYSKCKVGCYIDNLCMNHVMYADDICLMAPSPAALQELIDICYDFSVQNYLSFNSSKSHCMVFKPKSYKLSCPRLFMDNQLLKYTDDNNI